MARLLRYHPDFDSDVIQTAEWYARGNRQLAWDFIIKVEQAVASIIDAPERRSTIDFGLRYWPVERFPHVVVFDFTDTDVLLIGVMHPSQQPCKWLARRK